jgi:DNA-binding MarR family transcriptional regulator
VGEALWEVFRAVWIGGQRDCRMLGLTVAQARVMIAVDAGDSISPSELARQLGISRQGMSSAMNYLEGEGLLLRSHSSPDRRSVAVALTPRGRAMFRRLRERQHAVHRRVNGLFSGPEKIAVVRALKNIASELAGSEKVPAYRCSLCAARKSKSGGRP